MFIYSEGEGCTNLEEESKTFQPLFVLEYSYQSLILEFLWIADDIRLYGNGGEV